MKKLIVLLSLVISLNAMSQMAYDSLRNIPEKGVSCMVGQTALIVELNELYLATDGKVKANNAAFIAREFSIIKITRDDKRPQVWFQLASGTDTIYFRSTNSTMENPPFITTGYFEKQKQLLKGKKLQPKFEYETEAGTFTSNDIFTCTGLNLIESSGELIPSANLSGAKGTINVALPGFETTLNQNLNRFNNL